MYIENKSSKYLGKYYFLYYRNLSHFMGVICSSIQLVVLKQTHQCALQTWGLACARGSPKPEDAPLHVQLHELKTEPVPVPACSLSPQTTRHLQMSRTSLGGQSRSFSQAGVAAEPSCSNEEPAQLRAVLVSLLLDWQWRGCAISLHAVPWPPSQIPGCRLRHVEIWSAAKNN